jgi:hypothetical protein
LSPCLIFLFPHHAITSSPNHVSNTAFAAYRGCF